MHTFFDFSEASGLLVHLAAILQVIGFLNRRQLVLRGLTLASSLISIAYYYQLPTGPLWETVFWGSVLATANGIGIFRVILDHRAKHPSMQHEAFLHIMKVLSPSEFRRLMQLAQWRVAEQPRRLIREGEVPSSLYFIIGGEVEVGHNAKAIVLGPGAFVGEIAFLSDGPATADVFAREGAEYIEWSREALHKVIERTPTLGASMERLFNQELARKLVNSWS